jgi:hypothetical protein
MITLFSLIKQLFCKHKYIPYMDGSKIFVCTKCLKIKYLKE